MQGRKNQATNMGIDGLFFCFFLPWVAHLFLKLKNKTSMLDATALGMKDMVEQSHSNREVEQSHSNREVIL